MTTKKVISRLLAATIVALFIGLFLAPMDSPMGRLLAQTGTTCNNNTGTGVKPVLFWASNQLFGCPDSTSTWTVIANSSGPVSAFGASGATGGSGGQIISQPRIWAGNMPALGAAGTTGTVTFATGNAPTSATSYWVTISDQTSVYGGRVCCQTASSFGVVGASGSSGDIFHYHAVGN